MRGLALLLTLHLGRADRRSPEPGGDRWFAQDKAQHFFVAAFIQTASFGGFRTLGASRGGSFVGATAVTSAVSVGKELWDRTHQGDPSFKDLAWDAAGMLAASALLGRTVR